MKSLLDYTLSPRLKGALYLSNKQTTLKTSSVKVSYIFNTIVSIFNIIIPFITAPYLSRVLSPTGLGTFTYTQSITSYFNLVVGFGFSTYTTYSIARSREDINKSSQTYSEVFFAKLMLLVTIVTIFIGLTFLNVFGEDHIVMLIVSLTIFATGIDVSYLLKGFEKFKQLSIVTCSLKILNLILIFAFIKSQEDLILYFIFESALVLIQAIIVFILANKLVYLERVSIKNVFKQFKQAFVFFIPEVAVYLYTVIDTTMIGALASKEEVAYYVSANRIITIINAIVNSICPILLARISYLFEKKEYDKSIKMITKVLALSFLIEIPAVAGVLLVSDMFIPVYFGSQYIKAIPCLYVMSPLMIIINTGSIIINSYFVPSGKRNISTIIAFVAAGVNCIINYFLITKLGALGAAIATLISESIVTFLNLFISRHFINYKDIFKNITKIICSTLIMSIVIFGLNYFLTNKVSSLILLLIDIGVGCSVYFGFLAIFKDESFIFLFTLIKNKLFKPKSNN